MNETNDNRKPLSQEKFEKKIAKWQKIASPELQDNFEKANKVRFNGYHDPAALKKMCDFLERAGYVDMGTYRADKQTHRLRFITMVEGDPNMMAVLRKADPVNGVKALSQDELAVFGAYLQQQSNVHPRFFAERLKDGSINAMLESIAKFGVRRVDAPAAPRTQAAVPTPNGAVA